MCDACPSTFSWSQHTRNSTVRSICSVNIGENLVSFSKKRLPTRTRRSAAEGRVRSTQPAGAEPGFLCCPKKVDARTGNARAPQAFTGEARAQSSTCSTCPAVVRTWTRRDHLPLALTTSNTWPKRLDFCAHLILSLIRLPPTSSSNPLSSVPPKRPHHRYHHHFSLCSPTETVSYASGWAREPLPPSRT